MPTDEQHIALPKLYGAPAYARPTAPVEIQPRPFDPDDLPIEAAQTEEDRAAAEALDREASQAAQAQQMRRGRSAMRRGDRLSGQPFRLRDLAERLFGGSVR